MDYLTDTTFLIDLWRERGRPGRAVRFVKDHEGATVGLPWVVKGEFLRGARLAGHVRGGVDEFLNAFIVVWPTEDTMERYADVFIALRKANALIGANDLWIAACAMERRLPLITRNTGEFSRVEGLSLAGY